MDKLKQPLGPDDRVDLGAHLPDRLGSSFGGSGDAHVGSLSRGSSLTSSLRTRNICGPQIRSCSYGQSSYHGWKEDLEADSELEDGGTAMLPSGLLHDDGQDYHEFQDSVPVQFPSAVEFRIGSNLNGVETESGHQEFPWRVSEQRCGKTSFVGPRRDQSFDIDDLSNDNGFAGRHGPTTAGGYVDPNLAREYFTPPETVFGYSEAIRRDNESALRQEATDHNAYLSYFSGSEPHSQFGTVMPHMIIGCPDQFRKMTLRDSYVFAVCQQKLKEMEAFYGDCLIELLRARSVPYADSADLRPFAERGNLYQQEGLHHVDQRGMTAGNNTIEQSIFLDRSSAFLTNEVLASGLRHRTYKQGQPTSDDGAFEKFDIDAQSQAMINAELSQRNNFSSPQPTTVANTAISAAAAATSNDSTPASTHPKGRNLREETSCFRSRSLRNIPEKRPDGFPACNSYSTPRRKSMPSSSPATKALIAQGAKSISVILKTEQDLGSRGRSSHRAANSLRSGSTSESPGSGSVSPIHPRRLNMSNTDCLQPIPKETPSVELDVCNQGQFKTELCNNWQEFGSCRYGEHCRFAHGRPELQPVQRHPRYKSVPCHMIMSGKECKYGHRCHYRHSTEKELSLLAEVRLVPRTSS